MDEVKELKRRDSGRDIVGVGFLYTSTSLSREPSPVLESS
jgi:hypothetical protein